MKNDKIFVPGCLFGRLFSIKDFEIAESIS